MVACILPSALVRVEHAEVGRRPKLYAPGDRYYYREEGA